MSERTLTDADIKALAKQIVETLPIGNDSRLVDAQTVAEHLSVSPDYVYDHAKELGGLRLGDGPKSPLRFDLREIEDRLRERRDDVTTRSTRARRSRAPKPDVPLLPIGGGDPIKHNLPGSRAGRSGP